MARLAHGRFSFGSVLAFLVMWGNHLFLLGHLVMVVLHGWTTLCRSRTGMVIPDTFSESRRIDIKLFQRVKTTITRWPAGRDDSHITRKCRTEPNEKPPMGQASHENCTAPDDQPGPTESTPQDDRGCVGQLLKRVIRSLSAGFGPKKKSSVGPLARTRECRGGRKNLPIVCRRRPGSQDRTTRLQGRST